MSRPGSRVLIDTGFMAALFLKHDRFHVAACEQAEALKDRVWITTWPVVTEVSYFLQKHAATRVTKFLSLIECSAISIFELDKIYVSRISKMIQKYSDYEVDLADASLVIAAEQLEISDILSTDFRDFAIYRWNGKPFRNLLEPKR